MIVKYKALVIDDETPARDIIKEYLKNVESISVIGECSNGFEALKIIQEQKPDMLFLDVQMPKISGLELLEVLDDCPVVVFTTAYDQYALKAFELSAVDYLLKPFSKERFDQAIEKILEKLRKNNKTDEKHLIERVNDQEIVNRIVVKSGSRIVVIPLVDIIYIEAQEDYVMIHTSKGRYMKSQTMHYYETHLSPDQFVRIHRSFIVNVSCVEKLEPYDRESYVAVLSSEIKLRVSRSGYKKLKNSLNF
ncbi:MAG: LytTR family transcriptional regulator DNA-binding domain-containing protein [Marinilabiliaceae bacterium]|nr:LytTR family transcriptional regulator DNA-binding domain-containing protein [Marinilabiliaceae bacterium]